MVSVLIEPKESQVPNLSPYVLLYTKQCEVYDTV